MFGHRQVGRISSRRNAVAPDNSGWNDRRAFDLVTATVYRDSAYFIAAGDANWSIPRQARSLMPNLTPGAELYFTGIPDDLTQEIRYVFRIQ